MTWHGLLVSVRTVDEARAALAGGAAIIDVKEPAAGSLGAAAAPVVSAIGAAVEGAAPCTVAAGELQDEMADPGRTARWLDAISVLPAAVKLGLAGLADDDWQPAFEAVMRGLPPATARVAVAYADWQRAAAPHPLEIVAAAPAAGCSVLLVDTADKAGPPLFEACRADELASWIGAARIAGLRVAAAGRIGLDDIPLLQPLAVDVVALRSAVCSNGRSGTVDATLVRRAADAVALLETFRRATARDPRAPLPRP